MKAALELLRALQERWPAHPPRHHALLLCEDGRLLIQLGLEWFHLFAFESDDDLNKSADQIIEAITPLLTAQMAKLQLPTVKERDLPWCCYIPEAEQGQASPPGCPAVAEWNIHADSDPPDLITQACSWHLGALMSDKGHHSVWPVDKKEPNP